MTEQNKEGKIGVKISSDLVSYFVLR